LPTGTKFVGAVDAGQRPEGPRRLQPWDWQSARIETNLAVTCNPGRRNPLSKNPAAMGKHYIKFKGFTNFACEFYPCHQGIKKDFNCLFCYCPLLERECPGPYKVFTDKYDNIRKDCSECNLPHDGIEQSWRFIQMWVATASPWDKTPQSREKIRKYAQLVKTTFDPKDIEWASTQVAGR
jgi:Zn-finger protein